MPFFWLPRLPKVNLSRRSVWAPLKEKIMKYTTLVVGSVSIAACAFSTLCSAQSGTPSLQEVENLQSRVVQLDEQPEVDDYARYLMVVDGMARDRAVAYGHNDVPSQKVAQKDGLGSYGRYLMVVDGMTHSEASAAAANHDHPGATQSLAKR